jgi:hypothetical protein
MCLELVLFCYSRDSRPTSYYNAKLRHEPENRRRLEQILCQKGSFMTHS